MVHKYSAQRLILFVDAGVGASIFPQTQTKACFNIQIIHAGLMRWNILGCEPALTTIHCYAQYILSYRQ